jgi:hypothetical protein
MNDEHIGDDAELYALGALDPVERSVVERHVAQCVPCAARVAQAESVAATLATALPSYEPPARLEARITGEGETTQRVWRPSPWYAFAAAAAVLAGFLGFQDVQLQSERARSTVALTTIVHSHFLHVTMSKASPAAPSAKILYARDGAWLYVVVDRPASGTRVILGAHGAQRDAGELHAAGGVSTLFVPDAGRPDSVVLHDGAQTTEQARLVY